MASLSAREHDVVAPGVAGRSNDEISGDLGISTKTVEWHLSRLFERVRVVSRVELAMRAEREGWLALPTGARKAAGQIVPRSRHRHRHEPELSESRLLAHTLGFASVKLSRENER